MTSRWLDTLLRPIDGAWLAAFRFLFGTLLAFSLWRFRANGWVDELLIEPRFHFKYWGFEWVEVPPAATLHAGFQVLALLGACVALGLAFRLTAPLFALGFTYVQLIDVSTYLNHYYLAVLLCWLLALSPAGRSWSLDAWLRRRWRERRERSERRDGREGPRREARFEIAAGWHWLFRFQVGVVYTFAGLAKAQSDWLVHGQPLRIWLGQSTKLPLLGPLFTLDAVPLLLSWAGFLFDTTIVAWLLWRRSRPWAYLVVITFHGLTQLLFNIGMFPAIMIASALVFFSPGWPRHVLSRVARLFGASPAFAGVASPVFAGGASPAPASLAAPVSRSRVRQLAVVLGVLYCAVQLALPLRYLAYGGNVLWHEQGMRFSWRVMVRVKGGGTTFLVRQPSGEEWRVSPRDYLTARQEAEMSSQPDLILQLARHIARDFEARGRGPVQVRAESIVTLNGRRGAPIIDPQVDLARVDDGLLRAGWVLPAPGTPPPHTRPVL